MFDVLLTLTLNWKVVVVDFDSSINKHIALLEGEDQNQNLRNYAVAIESNNPFPFKEETTIYAKIKLECVNFDTFGVDEKKSDLFNTWITYTKMICNAKEIVYE